jgi:Leucine-rich repeat (LRR) protein
MQKLDLSGQIISFNSLKELLENFNDDIKELNLSKCSIDIHERHQVLEWISKLKNLRKLDLSESFYNYQPINYNYEVEVEVEENYYKLPENLEELNLRGNKLLKFPQEIFKSYKSLKSLNLSGNEIESLPEEKLKSLEKLEVLHLGGNKIQTLPNDIGELRNLKVLYLGGNQIEELPSSLGNLENLTCLSLHDNLIKQLPHTMVKLSNLQVLNIHKNQIKILPVEIIGLRHLKQLSVRENPLLTNFAQTIHMGVPSLLELSARAVKKYKLDTSLSLSSVLPQEVNRLLQDAKCCIGCGGTYFGQVGVSQVEFVDLCGSYRVPFLRYICSKNCFIDQKSSSSSSSSSTIEVEEQVSSRPHLTQAQQIARVRKVLLDKYNPNLSASVEVLQEEIEQNEIDNDFF